MKRFLKTEFKKIIEDCTAHYQKTPSLQEMSEYYNTQVLNENDFDDEEEYKNSFVSPRVLRHYVDIYNYKDLVKIRKRSCKKK